LKYFSVRNNTIFTIKANKNNKKNTETI